MKVLIDISEDVFTRLFDNGVDASIDLVSLKDACNEVLEETGGKK